MSFWDRIGAAAGEGIAQGARLGMESREEIDREGRAEERASKARLSAALTTAIANNNPGEVKNLRAEAANKGWTPIVSRADAAHDGVVENDRLAKEAANLDRNLTLTQHAIAKADLERREGEPGPKVAAYTTVQNNMAKALSQGYDPGAYAMALLRTGTDAGKTEAELNEIIENYNRRYEAQHQDAIKRTAIEEQRKLNVELAAQQKVTVRNAAYNEMSTSWYGAHLADPALRVAERERLLTAARSAGVYQAWTDRFQNLIDAPAEDPKQSAILREEWVQREADIIAEVMRDKGELYNMGEAYKRADNSYISMMEVLGKNAFAPEQIDYNEVADFRGKYLNLNTEYSKEDLIQIYQMLTASGLNDQTVAWTIKNTQLSTLADVDVNTEQTGGQPSGTESVDPAINDLQRDLIGAGPAPDSGSSRFKSRRKGISRATGRPRRMGSGTLGVNVTGEDFPAGVRRWASEGWQGFLAQDLTADDAFERFLSDDLWEKVRRSVKPDAVGNERYVDMESADAERVERFKGVYNAVKAAIDGEGDLDRLKELRNEAVALGSSLSGKEEYGASKLIEFIDKAIDAIAQAQGGKAKSPDVGGRRTLTPRASRPGSEAFTAMLQGAQPAVAVK